MYVCSLELNLDSNSHQYVKLSHFLKLVIGGMFWNRYYLQALDKANISLFLTQSAWKLESI